MDQDKKSIGSHIRSMGAPMIVLRGTYWLGIVLDGLATLRMIWPEFGSSGELGFHNSASCNVSCRFVMDVCAAVVAGWTALLFWADRKPLERRFVLVLTVCPVIVGITLSRLAFYPDRPLADLFAPSSLVQPVSLAALLLFAYVFSFRASRAQR